MKPLRDIADIQMGFPFRSRIRHEINGDVAVIQMKDINDSNELDFKGALRMKLDDLKFHHQLKPGDVIFRSRGSRNTAALVPPYAGRALLASPLLLIRPRELLPEFVQWFLNLPATQNALSAMAEGTSVRMISKAALESLEIPVPDLAIQKAVVSAANLAAEEQNLMERIAQKRSHLIDASLLQCVKNSR